MGYLIPTRTQWRRWSLPSKLSCISAYIGIVSLLLFIVFHYRRPANYQPERVGALTVEVRQVVDQILESAASKDLTGRTVYSDGLPAEPTEALARDPSNVSALIARGRAYCMEATTFGELRFREALNDFEKATQIDAKLADPHFGIGTVLYELAIFDLVDRGHYEIYQPAKEYVYSDGAERQFIPPKWNLFVDNRTRTVLRAALDEFLEGQRLGKLYHESERNTTSLFAIDDIEQRMRSISSLIKHGRLTEPDKYLVRDFSSFVFAVEHEGIEKVILLHIDDEMSDDKSEVERRDRSKE